jgi:hypothetical protein
MHVWSARPRGEPTMERMEFEALLRRPPPRLARWLDEVDPQRASTLLGGVYTEVPEVCGRPVHGWRRPQWGEWEDKTRVDELLARAAVPVPEHEVVDVEDPALAGHAARLDRGQGVVVAMDSSQGYLGDAKGLRWVRHADELQRCVAELRGRTRRVRISSYVSGVPCSILGMVLEDGVAVFDPLEIVTLRDPLWGGLRFCGSSNPWRPARALAEALREGTRRAGEELRRSTGYSGFFSLDAIASEEGFFATEVNPRHASGLGLTVAWPLFPDYLFHRAAQEHVPELYGVPSAWVEESFRAAIAAAPSSRIVVPADGEDQGEHATRLRVVTGARATEHVVRYRVEDDVASVIAVEPTPPQGILAPVAAALARHLGADELQSFGESKIVSTLAELGRAGERPETR